MPAVRRFQGDGRLEPSHESGPVAARRDGDDATSLERAADGVQILQTLPAQIAFAQMRFDAVAIDLFELAVEIQFNIGRQGQLAAIHAGPPVVTRAWVIAARNR